MFVCVYSKAGVPQCEKKRGNDVGKQAIRLKVGYGSKIMKMGKSV